MMPHRSIFYQFKLVMRVIVSINNYPPAAQSALPTQKSPARRRG